MSGISRRRAPAGRRWLAPAATLVLLVSGEGRAWACPSCFGDAEGPLVDGARLGIWLLLGVTLCLQAGFAAFFLYLRRRAAKATDQAHAGSVGDLQGEWTAPLKEEMGS